MHPVDQAKKASTAARARYLSDLTADTWQDALDARAAHWEAVDAEKLAVREAAVADEARFADALPAAAAQVLAARSACQRAEAQAARAGALLAPLRQSVDVLRAAINLGGAVPGERLNAAQEALDAALPAAQAAVGERDAARIALNQATRRHADLWARWSSSSALLMKLGGPPQPARTRAKVGA